MADDGDPWAAHIPTFIDDHYGSLRGQVRTHVVDAHLREHLPPVPAAVVDVGGGAGVQSLPLARRGHVLTIVDPSAGMLHRAAATLAREPAGVRDRVELVRSSGTEAVDLLGAGRFAGVLCHGVIPYLPDPGPVLAAVCALARPGGVVSVLAKNAATMAMRPAYEGRWRDALAAFDADSEVNALGLHTRGDTVEDLALQLAELGVGDISWYGVRLFAEAWAPDHRVERDEVDDVLAVEVEASRRDPYRRLSRLFHLVGRRHA
jgi:S-adenosylmethionine-dependent methyltransferase